MNQLASMEIARLRLEEARIQAVSAEGDRLIQGLLNDFACDFVLTNVPDGQWFPLPKGWQSGIADPIQPRWGFPPRDYRGPVAVSIETLRRIARCR